MLLRELFENLIVNEVSMAPKTLKKLAATINAYCGIEFELYYPGMKSSEDDGEPDFDRDERAYSISQILDFFRDNNDGYTIESLREQLLDEYYEYNEEERKKEWDNEREDLISDYIIDNDWNEDTEYEDAYEELDYSEEEIAICEQERKSKTASENELYLAARKIVKEKFDEKVEDAITREHRDSNYSGALEDFLNDYYEGDERDFLRNNRYNYMQDVYEHNNVGLNWPYYINENELTTEDISDKFTNDTGYESIGCKKYHGCEEYKGKIFVIEPDGSLNNPFLGYGGIEMVSPTLPLSEMIDTLHNVIKWAKQNDCYTDGDCGLHMNVSIQDIDMSSVDFIKLALFLGDDYVLEQFDRVGNTYAKRTLNYIQNTIAGEPEKGYMALDALQRGLNSSAGDFIQKSSGERTTSINIKGNRVEFRSAGNDWLGEHENKLVDTLHRFVVALDISIDPEKHKEEYSKKLYAFLNKSSDNTRISKALADYLSQSISDEQLMSIIKISSNVATSKTPDQYSQLITNLNAQLKAGKINKAQYQQALGMKQQPMANTIEKPPVQPEEWIVIGPNNTRGTYKVATAVAAINMLRKDYKLNSVRYPNTMFKVTPAYQTDIFTTFNIPDRTEQ